MKDRSATRRPWKALPRWIPLPNVLLSPSASDARPCVAASSKRSTRWCSAMAPPWIWNIAEDQFSEAVQIVDRFHAKQHLSELGKALYGLTTPRAYQWADRRKEELDTGKFQALLIAIRRHVPRSEDARRCLHYFQPTANVCVTQSFTPKVCALPQAWWKPDAKWPSVHVLNAPGWHWTVSRLQRHHRASLLKTQRPLSGFLGTQVRTQGRMTHHFLVVHPPQCL